MAIGLFASTNKKKNINREQMEIIEQKRRDLVEHLQTVGWEINHEWLDEQGRIHDPDGSGVLRRAVWGLHDGDYHLISHCKKYTVRIKPFTASFWRKTPDWKNIANPQIDSIEFTQEGIKCLISDDGIVKKYEEIVLSRKE